MKYRRTSLALVALGVLTALAACGASARPAPVTVTPSVTTPAAPATTAVPTTSSAAPAPATSAAQSVKVPNGVGLNYQAAQDLWRAAGLVVMPATDATGANRIPVIDSNWVVLAQTPAAGTDMSADSEITATVKKYTDR